jgi:geranylgeranyl reductase family protein
VLSENYDVIVVGAGPAGASAAYWLGEAGQRVLVLDKERLPRYKPCGGAVPKVVFDRFPFDFSAVIERWVRRVHFRFRDGREVAADLPDRAVATVMRDRFDFHIVSHAQAEVRDQSAVMALQQDESRVMVTTASGKTLHARYLIGADGANSRVARLVGSRRKRRMGAAMEVEASAGKGLLEEYADTALFIFGLPPKGYLWVFPKARHLSVGIGAFQGPVSNLRQILQQEMVHLGVEINGTRRYGHPLPVYVRREPLCRGRVLLVGDAARLMDPLLGEGIRHAVDSGRVAAESVLLDDPRRYAKRVHREIGRDLLWGRLWAQLFYTYPRESFELAVRNPLFVKEFLRLFAGEVSYRRMAVRAIPNVLFGLTRRLPVKHAATRRPPRDKHEYWRHIC